MLTRRIIWVITLLLMTVIFVFSSRPGDLSIQDSAWLLDRTNILDEEEALDTTNMHPCFTKKIKRLPILYYLEAYYTYICFHIWPCRKSKNRSHILVTNNHICYY